MRPDADETQIEAGPLRLAGRIWRGSDAMPALALHGWLDNAASFDLLAPLLPKRTICALDLAGHGRSAHRPPGAAYHFVDNVVDVVAAADALGWPRFDLVAHSMGAGIATLVAALVPERVRRLVLIEGLGPIATDPCDAPAVMRRALAERLGPNPPRLPQYPSFEAAVAARRRPDPTLSDDAATRLCRRGIVQDDGVWKWRSDSRLRWTSSLRLSEAQVLAFIAAIHSPACLIRGKNGAVADEEVWQRRVETCADLRVEILSGGHHLHMDEAAVPQVARVTAAFLS